MTETLAQILAFANNTGNVNMYMAHGGTNFGFRQGTSTVLRLERHVNDWIEADGHATCVFAGQLHLHNYILRNIVGRASQCIEQQALVNRVLSVQLKNSLVRLLAGGTNTNAKGPRFTDGQNTYSSWITSYDYDAPISEDGGTGQPGIGGDANKYLACSSVLHAIVTGHGVAWEYRLAAYQLSVLTSWGLEMLDHIFCSLVLQTQLICIKSDIITQTWQNNEINTAVLPQAFMHAVALNVHLMLPCFSSTRKHESTRLEIKVGSLRRPSDRLFRTTQA